jgi:hypothetical protein
MGGWMHQVPWPCQCCALLGAMPAAEAATRAANPIKT